MYDVNKFIADQRLEHIDPEGHLSTLDHWSPRIAHQLAAEEGLVLEEEHWQIIYRLRESFRLLGPDWNARQLTRELEREFSDARGRRHLYELFPRGPIVQACRLAGLPLPQGTLSASFGSVH